MEGLKGRPLTFVEASRSDRIAVTHPDPRVYTFDPEAAAERAEHIRDMCVQAAMKPLERDPSGLASNMPGAKLDDGKVMADLLEDFALALLAVAEVGTFGAKKYSRGGWQHVDNGQERYRAAKWRHILKGRHESHDPDSGLLHKAHEAWNTLAELELLLRKEKKL